MNEVKDSSENVEKQTDILKRLKELDAEAEVLPQDKLAANILMPRDLMKEIEE